MLSRGILGPRTDGQQSVRVADAGAQQVAWAFLTLRTKVGSGCEAEVQRLENAVFWGWLGWVTCPGWSRGYGCCLWRQE